MSEEERKVGRAIVKLWRDYQAIWKDEADWEGFIRHLDLNTKPNTEGRS